MKRRRFLQGLAAAGLYASANTLRAKPSAKPVRVASLQMKPRLGDVEYNLAQAEGLIDEAAKQGARWIVLPEMFTSAAAFHQDMLKAIRPLDGQPARLLARKARQTGATIGGSFLAQTGGQVRNRFLLYLPDGTRQYHDKDQPTYWESCYYQDGEDDGVLQSPDGGVGVALCWELIRSRTAARMRGRIHLLLAGSTWWTLPEEADADHPFRRANREMLRQAPGRMARMLGVPVIHAAHVGPFHGYDSPELPDVPYDSRYLGGTRICDADGNTLAHRKAEKGAGAVIADIDIPVTPLPVDPVPEHFWLPPQMPEEWKSAWKRWLPRGRDYYETVTLPYLADGKLREYIPPYLR